VPQLTGQHRALEALRCYMRVYVDDSTTRRTVYVLDHSKVTL
jgi:hypothetical protein